MARNQAIRCADPSSGLHFSSNQITDLINHVVLPPRLPQGEDINSATIEDDMLHLVQEVAGAYVQSLNGATQVAWRPVLNMFSDWIAIKQVGDLNDDTFNARLASLQPTGCLTLHLAAQNAGIMIIREDSRTIAFECFEASPTSHSVMSTQGRLLRTFPGRRVTFQADYLSNEYFRNELAANIRRLNNEAIDLCMASTSKAGQKVSEERDTTNPALVIDYLMNILGALGQNETFAAISKCTRDDVLWKDVKLPWRRSPFWLVLKVAIQRLLRESFDQPEAQYEYKRFMIHVVAQVLDSAVSTNATRELIVPTHEKLARRVHKLEQQSGEISPLPRVMEISQKAEQAVAAFWQEAQAEAQRNITQLPLDGWTDAACLSLPSLRNYLTEALHQIPNMSASPPFVPRSPVRISKSPEQLPSVGCQVTPQIDDRVLQLADIEIWVQNHLASWTQNTLRESSCWRKACDDLTTLVCDYWAIASAVYNISPVERSGALLVSFELWVALDKLCVASLPLLRKYSPEMPSTLLEPLLLRDSKQMHRLLAIETYIKSRHDSATSGFPGIFEDIQNRSFSNQYYDSSKKHKDLCARIARDDAVKRARKVAELGTMTARYNGLIDRAARMGCGYIVNRRGHNIHNRYCDKCALNHEAKVMRISVHEKSLPESVVQFKAAVFELAVPVEFAAWRDTTWFLLHVSQQKIERSAPKYVTLQDYPQLATYAEEKTRKPRITLASASKPFTVAHYKSIGFPTAENSVCMNNGLIYAIWSGDEATWVKDSVLPSEIKSLCIMTLPLGPYNNLDWASLSSRHTANHVMARQIDCHRDLEMREFVAFGSLRAGEQLQWLNILRELSCNNLDHNASAVNTLFQQAAYEAGTSNGQPLRHAHSHFEDPAFCRKLLLVLRRLATTVEMSWNEQQAMSTVIQLASRLLSLTSSTEVIGGCLELMRKVRSVTLGWCRYLKDTHLTATRSEEEPSNSAVVLLLGAAILCFSTFDIEDVYVDDALESAVDLAIAAEVHTTIHDHLPGDLRSLPDDLQCKLLRRTKTAHAIESRLRLLSMQSGGGLNDAVGALWNGAILQARWNETEEPNSQWLTNTTVTKDSLAQIVHYNLITGALLVDGRPLGKVPDEYKKQPIFQALFGTSVPGVYASDMPGMLYRMSQYLQGNQVHIGFKDKQVIVKARHGDRILQAIPPDAFLGDFPSYFIDSFVHWLDEKTGEIEFRPKISLWQTSDQNWKLNFSGMDLSSAKATMCLRHKSLIDHTSSLGQSVSHILGVLDSISYIHITVTNDEHPALEVDLHRYNLHFVVTPTGKIKSVEYNALVDLDQSVGTLIGLQNKLILRDEVSIIQGTYERSVLVPFGAIVTQKTQRHVQVAILPESGLKQQYFVYRLDRHLHKLRGPGDSLSSLHKAHLHAVTSYTLPDPFTQTTGTEEALEILHEALTFSGCPLTDEALYTLDAIARLTPSRQFYPRHLSSMQTVSWNESLSPLSQHDGFYQAAKAIVDHANQFSAFYAGSSDVKSLKTRGEQALLERAQKRNTVWCQQRYGPSSPAASGDRVYSARDRLNHDERSQRVYRVAKLIKEWRSDSVPGEQSLLKLLEGWEKISGYHVNFGVASLGELTSLKFAAHWGSLYELCRFANRRNSTFQLMFLFCAIAFGTSFTETDVRMQALLAFAFSSSFRDVNPPAVHDSYTLGTGSTTDGDTVRSEIEAQTNAIWSTESIPPDEIEPEERLAYISDKEQKLKSEIDRLHAHIMSQWPSEIITTPYGNPRYLQKDLAIKHCQVHFNEWHKNRRFTAHVKLVQSKLGTVLTGSLDSRLPPLLSCPVPETRHFAPISRLPELLQDTYRARAVMSLPSPEPLTAQSVAAVSNPQDFSELDELVRTLRSSADSRRNEYGEALHASLKALKDQAPGANLKAPIINRESIFKHYSHIRWYKQSLMISIRNALAPTDIAQSVLGTAGLWPRVTVRSLMNQLCNSNISSLSNEWRTILLNLGEAITKLQRCERLLKAYCASDMRTVSKELETPGRQGWSAVQHPGWLLLEIENNLTIRPQQAKVALEMMMPSAESNSVLQLNMGEGKSSVITPMVVIALADTTQLVRVIILKPLLRQTEQLLSQRLGGLLNQKVYHIPFSRRTKLDGTVVNGFASILRQCEAQRGVLLALPEHILSFRLMGKEKMSSDQQLAASLLGVERWQQQHCRDVLDESDEILGTHFQLVYTVGTQNMLDGQPDRWLVTQALLARLNYHAEKLGKSYPDQLEITRDENFPTAFPVMVFLRRDVGEQLTALLVEDIMEGHLLGFSFDVYTEKARSAIKNFISDRRVNEIDVATVTRNCAACQHYKILLVLRGLIAHGILLFALQSKRWLVDYGLDPGRCLMAVPYRAKSVPSLSSEYGHPDVAILLTSLSYYYTGLTYTQVRQCLAILLKDTNADDVYSRWIAACASAPENLRSLEAVNLDDEVLCTKTLFPMLHRNIEVANFYLSKVVFPKEGKEFAKKISASGWDIPSPPSSGKLTTGFSGTNDTRFLLPLSIKQGDMPDLQHTNAMVLGLILREENKSYVYAATAEARKLDTTGLLSMVSRLSPAVTVLIDVGAQVLEKTNLDVAKEWLELVDSAKAAIYFDDRDEAMVLDRNGVICPLRISAFRAGLQGCLIYLDEVHTRGIDLQIPTGARAAVTLGPRLVKDRLVQACMRMRKLGKDGHSLCFLSPPEVHHSICDFQSDSALEPTSKDVLAWCMEQTCRSMDILQPLRIMQGLEFSRRQMVWDTCLPKHMSPDSIVNDGERVARFWEGIQEPESQTLDQMYGVHMHRATTFARLLDRKSTDPVMQHLVQEFDAMDNLTIEDSSMDNEQEREVAHEIERERQVERPGKVEPFTPSISNGLLKFIDTGSLDLGVGTNIFYAFDVFMNSSAKVYSWDEKFDPTLFQIFVTQDFKRSVHLPANSNLDEYLRPVNWILTSLLDGSMLVIGPHEADRLLQKIKVSQVVRLHTFAPKTSRKMVAFDDLDFYTPSSKPGDLKPSVDTIRDLNLFAGSLYLDNISEYNALCHFLGVVTPSRRPADTEVGSDGFASPSIRKEIGWPEYCPFEHTPLSFLRQVFSLRMYGQDYSHTHMGFLVAGNSVRESAFERMV